MIPKTVGAVLGLLFVVGPGLAFEVIREHYRPTAESSTFREAASVGLASLVFTFAALILLAIGRAWWPTVLPDPRDWLDNRATYVADHYQLVARLVVSGVVLSTGLSALISWLWFRRDGARIDPNTTEWFELFRTRRPKGAASMVRVRLTDGSEYQGMVVSYSANILPAERELVLGPALQQKGPGEAGLAPLPDGTAWSRMFVVGSAIATMWVRYVPQERPSDRITKDVGRS